MTTGTVAIGAVLALGLVGVVAVQEERPPTVDAALAQALLPVIDEALQNAEKPGALNGTMRARWFCAETVIEVRPDGEDLKVGLDAMCEELGTDGTALRTGTAWRGAKVVTVTGEPHRVLNIETPPDGAGNAAWIDQHFSPEGAAEIHRRIGGISGDNRTTEEARQAFSLPPNAPRLR